MANIERHIELLYAFFEKQKSNYPDALGYSRSVFVAQKMLSPFANREPRFTPAQVVCEYILFGGFLSLFNEFVVRNEQEKGRKGVQPDEIQGYMDAIALYVSACYAKSNNVSFQRMFEGATQITDWDGLQDGQQERAREFVDENGEWALQELDQRDYIDGFRFMNKLVRKISNDEYSTPLYVTGIKTARDTLGLYVDCIMAYLRGDFYTGDE